jgi:hypothetical protein
MDVAGVSMLLKKQAYSDQVNMRVVAMALDNMESEGAAFLKMLAESTKAIENTVKPYLGSIIDIRI